jgi:hypothetical protein
MNRKFLFTTCLLTLSWLLGLSQLAYACTCAMPKPPCEEYWQKDAVFVGEVTALKAAKDAEGWQKRLVTLAITEAFRGVTGKEVTLSTGLSGGDCGFGFQPGGQYLVYAYRNKQSGQLSASSCSRTRKLAEAESDLAYLRSLAKGKTGAYVLGQVVLLPHEYREGAPPHTPQANLRVTLTGQETRFTATTDQEGRYRLEGIPAGKYKVSLKAPAGVIAPEPLELILHDNGCADASFWLRRQGGRMRGKVFDQQGQPGTDVELFLRPLGQSYGGESAMIKEDGSYEFETIRPGQYQILFKHLGYVRGEKLALAYHPATFDATQATLLTIGEGETFDGYALHIPPFPKQRMVEGVAVNAKGQPLANAIVNYGVPNENLVANVRTDAEGKFTFSIYEGIAFYARVILEPSAEKFEYYRWVPFPAGAQRIKVIADQRME